MGQCVGKPVSGRKRRGQAENDEPSQRNVMNNNIDGETIAAGPSSPRKKKTSSRGQGSSGTTSTHSVASGSGSHSNTNNDNSNGPSAGDDRASKSKKKKETAFSRKNLEKMFDRYKDTPESTEVASEMEPVIGPEGIERLCREIDVDPDDAVLLVLAYHLSASEMGYFYRDEWINGLEKLKLDTPDKIKDHVEIMRNELEDTERLKIIYRWMFGFAKTGPEQKCVDIETSIGLLNLLLAPRFYHVKNFVEFLQSHPGSVKALNLDQWTSLYEFAVTVKEDFSNYDENGAWPCVMDDYVQWKMGGKGANANAGEVASENDRF